jgi:hypothetical protein
MSEVVYFVSNGYGAVKIGYSSKLSKRLFNLKSASPNKLELIAHVPGNRDQERLLHKSLVHLHIAGEWFRDCEELRVLIADVFKHGLPVIECEKKELDQWDRQAQELCSFIFRYAPLLFGADALSRLSEIDAALGLKTGTLWSLKYRPNILMVSTYFNLIDAAYSAIQKALVQAQNDADAVLAIIQEHAVSENHTYNLERRLKALQASSTQTIN